MQYIITLLFALLLVFPSFAQSGVDNCCGIDGRECVTRDDWTAGYFAWQHNQCTGAQASSSPAHGTDLYFWRGGPTSGWDTVGSATLTTGKWQLWITGNHPRNSLNKRVWVRLTSGSECFRPNWHAEEEGAWWWDWAPRVFTNEAFFFGWNRQWYTDIAVRNNCQVSVAVRYAGDPDWRVRLKKVDDNI